MPAKPAISAAPVDLHGRTVLVTGASPGSLGFETARTLAGWGAEVAVSSRSNTAAVLAALGAGITGHGLELSDACSVRAFADWFRAGHDRLDVLVNNAGIHLDLRSQWKQPNLLDGHEIHWRTNYLGTMHLTHELLPLLASSARTTGDARVVNVVSKLHVRGNNAALFAPLTPYNSWAAYGTSKLALMHASTELQRRFAASGVHGYSLHPGSVYTHIADRGLAGNPILGALRKAAAPLERRTLLSPLQGAQTSLYCAGSPEAEGGLYYKACRPAEPSSDALDAAVGRRLWDETEAWVLAQ